MDTFELVHSAGLPKKEAAVYTALLESGQQSISDLARETHINRPALYEVLPRLERRKLVSKVKVKNRYQYVAESPAKLLQAYEESKQEVGARLAELAERYAAPQAMRPRIKYFEGEDGLVFVFDDVAHSLPRGAEFYRYSGRVTNSTKFGKTFYAAERDRKKLERLVITGAKNADLKKPKLDRAIRVIPEEFDLFQDDVSLVIYGDKTAYLDYESKTSFIVESPKIARFQEKLFKLLWKKLER